jgi:prohibitin 1
MRNEAGIGIVAICVVAAIVFIGLIALLTGIYTVPAGYVGVVNTFGTVEPMPQPSGLHFKYPWSGVTLFSTQTQKYYDTGTPGDKDVAQIQALSSEGMTVTMEIAVNYHLEGDKTPDLFKEVGEDYQTVIMKPSVHSVPRDIIAKYDAMTLYQATSNSTEGRTGVEQQLFDGISKQMLKPDGTSRGIIIEKVYLRNIMLPPSITSAIEAKQSMQQQIQEKTFEVEKQKAESDRMRAEAQGIADANKIIANSLSPSYLQWYAIEMMKNHQGATYFIPIGSDGISHPQIVLPLNNPTNITTNTTAQ